MRRPGDGDKMIKACTESDLRTDNFTRMPMSSSKKARNASGRWLLYILKCSDNTFYTGITNDLQQRLDKHNDGSASRYTRSRRPVKLIYFERCLNKSSALKKEFRMKSLSRTEKERYIQRKTQNGIPDSIPTEQPNKNHEYKIARILSK